MRCFFKIIFLLASISFLASIPVMAEDKVLTQVKVIHASDKSHHIDPGLAPLISEIRSVMRYTSYRLLSSENMTLGVGQNGRVGIPGGRTLIVVPLPLKGQRIPYQIKIMKNNRSIFQTRIQLNNNSSVTIGGPKYKNGVILLNIRGSAR